MSVHNYFFYYENEMPWKIPYKIKGKNVLVKRGKKWVVLKKCLSKRDAIHLLRELTDGKA